MPIPEAVRRLTVGLSVYPHPEMHQFGLRDIHFFDYSLELAPYLFSMGARIALCFEWTDYSVSHLYRPLAEIAGNYAPDDEGATAPIVCLVPSLPGSYHSLAASLRDVLELVVVDTAAVIASGVFEHYQQAADPPVPVQVTPAAAVRVQYIDSIDAHIVAGGSFSEKDGGVVEEFCLALWQRKPVYLLGGMGGGAGALVDLLFAGQRKALVTQTGQAVPPAYRTFLKKYAGGKSMASVLSNQLDEPENRVLFQSMGNVELAGLPLKGLSRFNARRTAIWERQFTSGADRTADVSFLLHHAAGNKQYTAYCLHQFLKIGNGTSVYRPLLGEINRMGPQAATALLEALADQDIRRMTARALGQLGTRAKSAVPALVAALRDENEIVRFYVAEALGQIGGEAVPALAEALKNEDVWVRFYAAQTLGSMGPAAQPAVAALAEAIRDANKMVRIKVAVALGRIEEAALAASLTNFAQSLTSGGPETRVATARELGTIVPLLQEYFQEDVFLKSIDGITRLLSEVADDDREESKVRSSAEKALASINGPGGRRQQVLSPVQ